MHQQTIIAFYLRTLFKSVDKKERREKSNSDKGPTAQAYLYIYIYVSKEPRRGKDGLDMNERKRKCLVRDGKHEKSGQ